MAQLLTDLLPLCPPPQWQVTIATNYAVRKLLTDAPTIGEAVQSVYDEMERDEVLASITVETSVLWRRWREAMDRSGQ